MDSIGKKSVSLEHISRALREAPLPALRQMLPDKDILQACAETGHFFRRRLYDPVVTVFHFLLQAVQREESFAATWEELWSSVIVTMGMGECKFNSSALSQARSRFPKAALDTLVKKACNISEARFSPWRGFRLLALDSTTVSMPAEKALFEYFGRHRAHGVAVRYPLGTLCSLLTVGNSLIADHRFGPHDPGELKTATPLLDSLGEGDLLLADRLFAGSPALARILAKGADFLMRKNARLIPQKLPVIERYGQEDFLTDIPMSIPARKLNLSLPKRVRVRLFNAKWTSPAGEKLQEWFVTSLHNSKRFSPHTLANLYHQRWRVETSYLEFKVFFHADVLRSKTVDNIRKEFAAHVLAYQLLRRLIVEAAKKHHKQPTKISVLHAARWVISFCSRMSVAPARKLPLLYERLLDAIASTEIDIRPGRLEPRAIRRERKHYAILRQPRAQWRKQRLAGTG